MTGDDNINARKKKKQGNQSGGKNKHQNVQQNRGQEKVKTSAEERPLNQTLNTKKSLDDNKVNVGTDNRTKGDQDQAMAKQARLEATETDTNEKKQSDVETRKDECIGQGAEVSENIQIEETVNRILNLSSGLKFDNEEKDEIEKPGTLKVTEKEGDKIQDTKCSVAPTEDSEGRPLEDETQPTKENMINPTISSSPGYEKEQEQTKSAKLATKHCDVIKQIKSEDKINPEYHGDSDTCVNPHQDGKISSHQNSLRDHTLEHLKDFFKPLIMEALQNSLPSIPQNSNGIDKRLEPLAKGSNNIKESNDELNRGPNENGKEPNDEIEAEKRKPETPPATEEIQSELTKAKDTDNKGNYKFKDITHDKDQTNAGDDKADTHLILQDNVIPNDQVETNEIKSEEPAVFAFASTNEDSTDILNSLDGNEVDKEQNVETELNEQQIHALTEQIDHEATTNVNLERQFNLDYVSTPEFLCTVLPLQITRDKCLQNSSKYQSIEYLRAIFKPLVIEALQNIVPPNWLETEPLQPVPNESNNMREPNDRIENNRELNCKQQYEKEGNTNLRTISELNSHLQSEKEPIDQLENEKKPKDQLQSKQDLIYHLQNEQEPIEKLHNKEEPNDQLQNEKEPIENLYNNQESNDQLQREKESNDQLQMEKEPKDQLPNETESNDQLQHEKEPKDRLQNEKEPNDQRQTEQNSHNQLQNEKDSNDRLQHEKEPNDLMEPEEIKPKTLVRELEDSDILHAEVLQIFTQSVVPELARILHEKFSHLGCNSEALKRDTETSIVEDSQIPPDEIDVHSLLNPSLKIKVIDTPKFESTRIEEPDNEDSDEERLFMDLTENLKEMDTPKFKSTKIEEPDNQDGDEERLSMDLTENLKEIDTPKFENTSIKAPTNQDGDEERLSIDLTENLKEMDIKQQNVDQESSEVELKEEEKTKEQIVEAKDSIVKTNGCSNVVTTFDTTDGDEIKPSQEPLRFHSVHGDNIRLSNNNFRVQRKKKSNFFSKGIAFSSRPVAIGEKVSLHLKQLSSYWLGFITIGFTTNDPMSIADDLPSNVIIERNCADGFWAEHLDKKYYQESCWLHYYLNSSGNMCFGVNGVDKIEFLWNLETMKPVWALVDVFGYFTIVELDIPKELRNTSFIESSLHSGRNESGNLFNHSLDDNEINKPSLHYQIRFVPLDLYKQFEGNCMKFLEDRGVCVTSGDKGGCIDGKFPLFPGQTIVVQNLSVGKALFFIGVKYGSPTTEVSSKLPEPVKTNVVMHVKDELAIMFTESGEIRVTKNLDVPKTILKVNRSQELWPFVQIFKRNQMIKMWSSNTPSLAAFQT